MLLFHGSHADFSHQIINLETAVFVIIFSSAHMGRVVDTDHICLLCMDMWKQKAVVKFI